MFSWKSKKKELSMSTAQRERALALATKLGEKLFLAEVSPELDGSGSCVFVGALWAADKNIAKTPFWTRLKYLEMRRGGAGAMYEITMTRGRLTASCNFVAGDSLDWVSNVLLEELQLEGYSNKK